MKLTIDNRTLTDNDLRNIIESMGKEDGEIHVTNCTINAYNSVTIPSNINLIMDGGYLNALTHDIIYRKT